jgi:cell division protein FtsB
LATKTHLQAHGAARTWITRALLLALALVCAYLTYEFGRISAGYDVVDAAQEREAYEDRIDTLHAEIADLKQEVALLETHREIDREAYREVEGSLTSLQAKIQEQRDAIAFYRGIVSPRDGNSGLRAARAVSKRPMCWPNCCPRTRARTGRSRSAISRISTGNSYCPTASHRNVFMLKCVRRRDRLPA